jgi:hypothetical protein
MSAAGRDRAGAPIVGDAPEERPERLATLRRGDNEELRVVWDHFRGFRFLSLRVWYCAADDEWRPSRTGISVKLRELRQVADAFTRAVALDDAARGER